MHFCCCMCVLSIDRLYFGWLYVCIWRVRIVLLSAFRHRYNLRQIYLNACMNAVYILFHLFYNNKKMFFLTYIKSRSLFRLHLFFIRKYCKRRIFFHLFRQIKLLFHTFGWKIDGQHQTSGKMYSNLIFHLLLALCMYFFIINCTGQKHEKNERFLNVWPMMNIRPMIISKILCFIIFQREFRKHFKHFHNNSCCQWASRYPYKYLYSSSNYLRCSFLSWRNAWKTFGTESMELFQ